MQISDDFYAAAVDESVDTKEWINELRSNYSRRYLVNQQTKQFYFRRSLVEYSVKTTISASLAIALIWGGPPTWIIGGAAVILRLSTFILNHYNPSQYVEATSYQAKVKKGELVDEERLQAFRLKWRQDHQNYFFSEHVKERSYLQRRIAFALIAGFVIFTVLNASLTLPILLASMFYADSLIKKASEKLPPYLEGEDELSTLYLPQI